MSSTKWGYYLEAGEDGKSVVKGNEEARIQNIIGRLNTCGERVKACLTELGVPLSEYKEMSVEDALALLLEKIQERLA